MKYITTIDNTRPQREMRLHNPFNMRLPKTKKEFHFKDEDLFHYKVIASSFNEAWDLVKRLTTRRATLEDGSLFVTKASLTPIAEEEYEPRLNGESKYSKSAKSRLNIVNNN